MKKSAQPITGICKSCGRYFFRVAKTRRPQYCQECADYRKRESNRSRQRDFRRRHAKRKNRRNEQPSGKTPRPVALDTRADLRAFTPTRTGSGLFATLPDPGRTQKRKRLGLP